MDDEEWRNPHCASAVLKMYLNELPTCVFTEERYGSFVGPFKGGIKPQISFVVTQTTTPSLPLMIIHVSHRRAVEKKAAGLLGGNKIKVPA